MTEPEAVARAIVEACTREFGDFWWWKGEERIAGMNDLVDRIAAALRAERERLSAITEFTVERSQSVPESLRGDRDWWQQCAVWWRNACQAAWRERDELAFRMKGLEK